MSDQHIESHGRTQLKRRAIDLLCAIRGFRGLEIDGDELIAYVVSVEDEAALPASFEGLNVRAVVAERLRAERQHSKQSGVYRVYNSNRKGKRTAR